MAQRVLIEFFQKKDHFDYDATLAAASGVGRNLFWRPSPLGTVGMNV